ncbi:hypothetical protein FALBO_14205 [Fusarium albosuccineum]|uniref:Uncharacterized protein n=1 Tax=Fusarium albosuccineum TaxID=1237068 RepID=A0A8H4P4N6_9HYPO|nr:hypothetical protein FALBO_14205 [Fusarium albosuccineum]
MVSRHARPRPSPPPVASCSTLTGFTLDEEMPPIGWAPSTVTLLPLRRAPVHGGAAGVVVLWGRQTGMARSLGKRPATPMRDEPKSTTSPGAGAGASQPLTMDGPIASRPAAHHSNPAGD